jgi:hypothetical protein
MVVIMVVIVAVMQIVVVVFEMEFAGFRGDGASLRVVGQIVETGTLGSHVLILHLLR